MVYCMRLWACPYVSGNKPTPVMRAKGIKQGNAKADELAISYAMMMDASDEQKKVLDALRLIKMVETREGLYYSTYPYFVHWKTGRIHSSHNQCATNTVVLVRLLLICSRCPSTRRLKVNPHGSVK